MKKILIFFIFVLTIPLGGCGKAVPACPLPTGTPQYLSLPPSELPTPTPASGPYAVKIGSSEINVDKIVQGPLCNEKWNGTIYVGCDVQVYPWTDQPTFLKDCELTIDPQTVVYVAYHNNAAYFEGCSCHTGSTPQP